ncbi:hypothetical protein [uncultured Roseivirga sp.]|uniref:hypothetical protein n=1 Tax=uncultured Roseivirga sp. TaxID=543088 RepID=UPI0030DD6F3D|tara:strand:- start:2672 stop:3595 length:924 start_codon:yes stop_codon:yes gene_type:complete
MSTIKEKKSETPSNIEGEVSPLLRLSHPLLRQLSTHADHTRLIKDMDRHVSVFHFKQAPNNYLTIAHEELLQNQMALGGLSSGTPQGSAFTWLWPWDIVRFTVNASSQFLNEITRFPHLVYNFFSGLDGGLMNYQNMKPIEKLKDFNTMKRFISLLGSHTDFKSLYPNAATLCRVISGETPPQTLPQPEQLDPNNEKVVKLIKEIAVAVGIISGIVATVVAAVLGIIAGLIGLLAAGGVIAIATIAAWATALVVCAIAGIALVIIGFSIAIIAAVVALVMAGILIFHGSNKSNIDDFVQADLVPNYV